VAPRALVRAFESAVRGEAARLLERRPRGIVFHIDLAGGAPVHASLVEDVGPPRGDVVLGGPAWGAFSAELDKVRARGVERDEIVIALGEVLRRLAAGGLFAGMPGELAPAVIHEREDGDDWAAVYLRHAELDQHRQELARRPSAPPDQTDRGLALVELFDRIVRQDVVGRLQAPAFAEDRFDRLELISMGGTGRPYQGLCFVARSEQAAARALALYRDLGTVRGSPEFDARVRRQAALLGRPNAAFHDSCRRMFEPDFEGDTSGPTFEIALASGVAPRHYDFFGAPRLVPDAERGRRFIELVAGHREPRALAELFLTELPARLLERGLLSGLRFAARWTLESRFDLRTSERVVEA
jgi:hypothetical protein